MSWIASRAHRFHLTIETGKRSVSGRSPRRECAMNSEHDAKWMRNWQDLASPALGAWLLVSPWALRFAAANNAAAEAAWIAGAALFAASLMNSVSLRFSQGIGE